MARPAAKAPAPGGRQPRSTARRTARDARPLPRRGQLLVSLEGACVALGGATVLAGVTLSLRAGERLALLGGNGSGKSTLLRLLRGDQWLDPARPGRRTFHWPDGPQQSPIGARERMALVSPEDQDAYLRRELDLPAEAVIRSGLDGALYPMEGPTPERTARVRAAARAMGVEPLLRRSFLTLSRGEGRKVLVARALAAAPAVLLLDEVCDGLDAGSRDALLGRLARVAARGTTVVTAVHRAEELFAGVRRAVRLERGRLVDEGEPAAVVAGWRRALEASPTRSRSRPGPGARSGPSPGARSPVFALRGATVLVEGRAVLDQVTWAVGAGEAWAVSGPNGAGKSTLLRLLAGEEQPARGTIARLDLGRRAATPELRRRIGQVSPELQARHRLPASGLSLVLSGFEGTIGLDRPATAGERRRAEALLGDLGLARLARRDVMTCSYGELRLLLLARALAPAPQVLLLDEPFAGLDPGARRTLDRALSRTAAAGAALVLVTHHEDEVPRWVARRARLEAGRLTETGPVARPVSSG